MVAARHLDYSDNTSFLRTVAKHPNDGSKNRDVGHSWIYLQGIVDNEVVYIEGGHSGERGLGQARYFDGIMNYIDFGLANPSPQQIARPSYEPNPVKYLWESQCDGFFQEGSGGHHPTFAAKFALSAAQFYALKTFIEKHNYSDYALVGNQCASFAVQAVAYAGVDLECEVTLKMDPWLWVRGQRVRLWTDESYQMLTISSPDVLERSLMQTVAEGKAQNALEWYLLKSSNLP